MSVVCKLILRVLAERHLNDLVLTDKELAVTTHRLLNSAERPSSHVLEGEDKHILVGVDCLLHESDPILFGFTALLLDLSESNYLIFL